MDAEKSKTSVDTAIDLVDLINSTAPGLATLIILIRKKDGGVAVATLLDEADAQFDKNIAAAQEWLAKGKQ